MCSLKLPMLEQHLLTKPRGNLSHRLKLISKQRKTLQQMPKPPRPRRTKQKKTPRRSKKEDTKTIRESTPG